ncbi:hypothetical protein BH24PSE2_BH24PSE2_19420 [soil metagenome]
MIRESSGDNRFGEQFEAVVERASYFYSTSLGGGERVRILRLSIYDRRHRQVKRVVLGEDARFLPRTEHGLRFFIPDHYHSRMNGLVCLSAYDASPLVQIPRRECAFENFASGNRIVTATDPDGRARKIDLREEFARRRLVNLV